MMRKRRITLLAIAAAVTLLSSAVLAWKAGSAIPPPRRVATVDDDGAGAARAILRLKLDGSGAVAPVGTAGSRSIADAERRTRLRVVADGRAHPELISDDIAYRHLLVATAPSELKSSELEALRRGIIDRMGLPASDRAAYDAALRRAHVWEEIERIRQDRQSLDVAAKSRVPGAGARLVQLMTEERALIRRTTEEVRASLSASGMAALERYLRETVKRQITIVGGVGHHDHGNESE